ncbi:DUF6020 family protein [Raoultibacter massiliensis]|uniref:DUF6020 family protein n=1 Tax=Raoultibacter massiliensis TaxID=1852371 RepID=A0ABV1JG61_9ACTN
MFEKQGYCLKSFVMALLSSFAICSHFTAVQDPDFSLPDLFYLGNRSDMLLAAVALCVLFVWYGKQVGRTDRVDKAGIVLSFLFSAVLVVGRAFTVNDVTYGVYGTFDTMIGSWQRCLFTVLVFAGLWIALYYGVRFLFEKLDALRGRADAEESLPDCGKAVHSRITRLSFFLQEHSPWSYMALFALSWLPYIIVFFPGTIYVDGAYQLRQFFGADPYTGHHPLATTLLLGSLVQVGKALGSDSIGIFLYVALQTLLVSYACARIVECIRKLAPGQRWIAVACVVFFAFVPVWGGAVVSVKKDALFYAAFGMLVVSVFELARRCASGGRARKRDYVRLFLLALAVSLIRNEGSLVACAILCCLGLYLIILKQSRRQSVFLAGLAICVVLSYGIGYKTVLMGALDAENGSISEALAIPLQQTARYWIAAPEDVTDSISEGVSRVLDTSGLVESVYNPQISDNIKFGFFHKEYGAGDLLAFARAYVEMGMAHPGLFAEAFVDQTLGWWYPELYGDPDHAVSGMGLWQLTPAPDVYGEVVDSSLAFQETGAVNAFVSLIDCFAYVPGIGMLVYPAVYLWLLAFLAAYLVRAGEKRKLVMILPFALNFLICIASPANGLTRYAVPIMMVCGILIAFTLGEEGESASAMHR